MSARQRIPTERREQGGRSPHLRISRRTPLTGPALARLALVVALAAATLLPLAGPAQAGGGSHSTPPAQGRIPCSPGTRRPPAPRLPAG